MRQRILAGIILSLTAATSSAALLSRLSGQAYYDTNLNITWLADANAAAGGVYDDSAGNGAMTWDHAQAWIASLNAANYLGVSDWRLPGVDPEFWDCTQESSVPGTVLLSEMCYQFNYNQVTASAPEPFTNLQGNNWYWTGTEFQTTSAWVFHFGIGGNGTRPQDWWSQAWAVRPGDIGTAVPVPAVGWLLAPAFVVVMRRRAPH